MLFFMGLNYLFGTAQRKVKRLLDLIFSENIFFKSPIFYALFGEINPFNFSLLKSYGYRETHDENQRVELYKLVCIQLKTEIQTW
jgi:hypothetical protein